MFSQFSKLLPNVSAVCLFCFLCVLTCIFYVCLFFFLVRWPPTVPISMKSKDPSGVGYNSWCCGFAVR